MLETVFIITFFIWSFVNAVILTIFVGYDKDSHSWSFAKAKDTILHDDRGFMYWIVVSPVMLLCLSAHGRVSIYNITRKIDIH
jgi:hypothetical protein